ncbi:MAG: ribulose-phosphate 3-epimerase [Deltaproteobacteria bacterium]|jgi:ribulose-phosphate 3-epimerase
MPLVAPSILAADLGRLADEVKAVESSGADWIHVDVMDGHFVPNLTMGPETVSALSRITKLPLDVHLMIENPADHIDAFADAGADLITIHREVVDDVEALFGKIEDRGCRPAVAINPETPVETVSPLISRAAMILVMSVNPGFAGQGFMDSTLPKLSALAELKARCSSDCLLEMDGGIKTTNAAQVIDAGVDVIVSGSGVFGAGDYAEAIALMQNSTGG